MKRLLRNAAGAFLGLSIGVAVLDIAAREVPPEAGWWEKVWDWWNTPRKERPAPPVVKTVRAIGNAEG